MSQFFREQLALFERHIAVTERHITRQAEIIREIVSSQDRVAAERLLTRMKLSLALTQHERDLPLHKLVLKGTQARG